MLGVEATKKEEQSREWDKQRQQQDEVKALNKRVQDMATENDQLRTQVQEHEAGDDGEAVETFEAVQDALKKNQVSLTDTQKKLQTASESLEKQNERIAQLETNLTDVSKTANSQAGQTALDNMCTPLDKKFGTVHRNQAIDAVEAKYQKFGIEALHPDKRREWVQDELEATYQRLASSGADTSVNGTAIEPLAADTSAGGSAKTKTTITEGTLDDVVGQLRKIHSG